LLGKTAQNPITYRLSMHIISGFPNLLYSGIVEFWPAVHQLLHTD